MGGEPDSLLHTQRNGEPMRYVFALALLANLSTRAFAVFDAQLLMGGASIQSEAVSADEGSKGSARGGQFGLSLHFDPFPGIPVAFGALYMTQGFTVDMPQHGSTGFAGALVGPEVMAWLPLASTVRPYVKGTYVLAGYGRKYTEQMIRLNEETGEETSYDAESTLFYSGTGTRAAAGLNWSPVRFLSIMGEYSMTWTKVRATKNKRGDGSEEELKNTPTEKLTTQGFLLGVGANI